MPKNTWTELHQQIALAEGWGIWACEGKLVIQRWGEADKFQSDDKALQHVLSLAANGSAIHRLAREIHMTSEHPAQDAPGTLFPAFDFEDTDGSVRWCVRVRLAGGDSEPVALLLAATKDVNREFEASQRRAALFAAAPEMSNILHLLHANAGESVEWIRTKTAPLLAKLPKGS